jgi:hypothetical protein
MFDIQKGNDFRLKIFTDFCVDVRRGVSHPLTVDVLEVLLCGFLSHRIPLS